MATTIPHRELRNSSSEILRRAQSGEIFEITNHGEVVAMLGPVESEPRHRLPSTPPLEIGGFSALQQVTLDHPIQDTLDDLRGDR